jgi:ribonuclease P/MRP protein subunit POP5
MPKQILPSMRERSRYIAFELISDSALSRGDVVKAVWGSVLRFLGELGASKTSLWVMDWDEKHNRGILKVNHKSLEEVRAAFTLIKEINDQRVIPHVLGVSGTVKKTRQKYLGEKS